ncbi:unnamed protein product [Durusdinium trenchii]|uniref:SAM domain-containing protein n=1 Tax=Durusdinium trenchii TaxID=1381693 RepID=A0ABP0QUS5_9DINO
MPTIHDLCDYLATPDARQPCPSVRSLPQWMVAQLRTMGDVQESSKLGTDGKIEWLSSVTSEGLTRIGIVHPLHQRRILREIQCYMLMPVSAAEDALPEPPVAPPEKVVRPRRPLVYERDTRWPFLDIACLKLMDVPRPTISAYGHSERRTRLAEEVRIDDDLLKPSKDSSRVSLAKTLEKSQEVFWRESTEEEEESEEIDWEEWLDSRLHSWGMLSLVDEALKAATLGDLHLVHDLVDRVRSHGPALIESLEKTPLPEHLEMVFPDMPEDECPPNTIWSWIMWRLEWLKRADRRVERLVEKATGLVDNVMGYSVSRDVSVRPSHEKRKATINMKKLLLGASAASSSSEGPSRSASSAVFFETAHAALKQKQEKPKGVEAFRRAAQQILSHIKAKRQDGLVASTKLLTCVAMQSKVVNLRQDLQNIMDEVDKWPQLISDNRESCDDIMERLHQASLSLFHHFTDLRQHIEVELREATIGDQGVVECCRLENKIVDVQRELASSLLLGEHALELAEKAGVGLRANGIPEPPNPWEGLTLSEPPWEASFLRALRKLEPLRRNLHLRRQGTAVTVSSTPMRRMTRKKTKTLMRPGQSIPEEVLAQLLNRQ